MASSIKQRRSLVLPDPYLVPEFGPRGYWYDEYSLLDKNHLLIEESDGQKAALYTHEWKNYVRKNQDHNIGGVAFCWRDCFEESATCLALLISGAAKSRYITPCNKPGPGKRPMPCPRFSS